jgi:hypothetical protein
MIGTFLLGGIHHMLDNHGMTSMHRIESALGYMD